MDKQIQICSIEQSMLGLYLYDTLWSCIDSSGININPLRYWTLSLSLIDLGL